MYERGCRGGADTAEFPLARALEGVLPRAQLGSGSAGLVPLRCFVPMCRGWPTVMSKELPVNCGLMLLVQTHRFLFWSLFFFLIVIFFPYRVSDVNLGRLVRGDTYDCLVPPTVCAVMELLEDLGKTLYHNYYINFSLTNFLSFSPGWETNIFSPCCVFWFVFFPT